jgi:amidase
LEELVFAGALEQAALVRAGAVSPVDLTRAYLERIDALDGVINSFVTVAPDAIDAARAKEASREDVPFHGVPIAIKDLHETAGLRTTYSSRLYAENVPAIDSAAVARLKRAGFVVLGKTNTPEFGTLPVTESILNGACRNPWETSRTPGGSSGGSAAAVAAGFAPIAEGGDGGGSIRIPAACCGLVGVKPERGRVSRAPWGAGVLALSTSGPIARTVRDAAAMLDALTGYELGDATYRTADASSLLAECEVPPAALRVAVTTVPPIDVDVEDPAADAALACARLLEELGHHVEEAAPAWESDHLKPEFRKVWQVGPPLAGIDRIELMEPINQALAEDALATSSIELAVAIQRLQAAARRVVAFWADVDVLVTPALARAPVPIGWTFADTEDPREQFERGYAFTPFTPSFNITGQAALALPWSLDAEGVPVGVQLVAAPGGEATLFRLAAQLEEARPWADRRPPLAAPA